MALKAHHIKRKATHKGRGKLKNFVYKQSDPFQGRYARYGSDDKFPYLLKEVLLASGTAISCVNRLNQFTIADGFKNETLHETPINKHGQTLKDLTSMWVNDFNYFGQFTILIKCNASGEAAAYYYVPTWKVRKKVNDRGETIQYLFNLTAGESYQKETWVEYPVYEPNDHPSDRLPEILRQTKEHGEQIGFMVTFHTHNVSSEFYGVPSYIAGLDDIESDSELQKVEKGNIKDGFKADVIISTVDDDSGESATDEDGNPILTTDDDIDEAITAFSNGESRVIRLSAASKDAFPQVTPFNNQYILDSVNVARDRVARTVCRHMGVPPILIGMTQPEGLGNAEALANNMKLFMLSVTEAQEWIANCLEKVMPQFGEIELTSLNIFDYIPSEYLEVLTEDELRSIIGYEPLPKLTTDEKLLSERLGVGGTQSLTAILENANLEVGQKVNILQVLFGLTEEDAKRMLNIPTSETTQVQAKKSFIDKLKDLLK